MDRLPSVIRVIEFSEAAFGTSGARRPAYPNGGNMIHEKKYIGDGCYVVFDGYSITLTTENGGSVTNTIVMEPGVFLELLAYVEAIRAESRS